MSDIKKIAERTLANIQGYKHGMGPGPRTCRDQIMDDVPELAQAVLTLLEERVGLVTVLARAKQAIEDYDRDLQRAILPYCDLTTARPKEPDRG